MNPSRRCVITAACLGACPRLALGADAPARPQAGDAVEFDLSVLADEELRVVPWKGQPVWILRRSPAMLRNLQAPELLSRLADPASTLEPDGRTPAYARNAHRSIKAEFFVGLALCPHAGCVPVARLKPGPNPERPDNWPGGFACPCHFATFDLAGRVFKDKPTDMNIEVPRHTYVSTTTIVVGRDDSAT
jgi:ubiquinol-cytochrome c reductase iron-sulfur subunit